MSLMKKEIKRFNFKLKFLLWKRVNDSKLIGKTYDQVFELFIYDNVESFVSKVVLRELNCNKEYKLLLGKVARLEKRNISLKVDKETLKNRLSRASNKINGAKASAKLLLEDL